MVSTYTFYHRQLASPNRRAGSHTAHLEKLWGRLHEPSAITHREAPFEPVDDIDQLRKLGNNEIGVVGKAG
jgi:hypothetical protein